MSYNNTHSAMLGNISDYLNTVCKNAYQQGRADEREHILEILHGIDRQIENLVICVLASECNERLKEQK